MTAGSKGNRRFRAGAAHGRGAREGGQVLVTGGFTDTHTKALGAPSHPPRSPGLHQTHKDELRVRRFQRRRRCAKSNRQRHSTICSHVGLFAVPEQTTLVRRTLGGRGPSGLPERHGLVLRDRRVSRLSAASERRAFQRSHRCALLTQYETMTQETCGSSSCAWPRRVWSETEAAASREF